MAAIPFAAQIAAFLGRRRLFRLRRLLIGRAILLPFDEPQIGRPDVRGIGVKPQGRIGDLHHIGSITNLKRDVGGHAGEQLEVGIRGGHDHRVRDHVLRRRRVHADFLNRPLKQFVGIGVDGERDRQFLPLGLPDQADVGLVDRSVHVDPLAQVGGDDEQLGCLKLGRQHLARIDLAIDDGPRFGRQDLAVLELGFGIIDLRLRHFDAGGCDPHLGFIRQHAVVVLVEFGLGDERLVFLAQLGNAAQIALGLFQLGLGTVELGPARFQACRVALHVGIVNSRVDFAQQVPLFDLLIELGNRGRRVDGT